MSALLPLYRAATTLAAPLISRHLKQRLKHGKEDLLRFSERLGKTNHPRPKGPLVWVHAASVGESISMLPLVDALLKNNPTTHFLMTSGTVTSACLLAERLPGRAIHQYVPIDRQPYVNAFLDHWMPDLVLWAESEFWPNLTTLPAARGIPMVLVNGRISPESYAKWRRWSGLVKPILKSFTLCLAQSDLDAERLSSLGASPVECHGNLKFTVPPLPADMEELARLEHSMEGRPRWLAASTHPGEETQVWTAHQITLSNHPGLLTVIVPRHTERGPAIAETLTTLGANVSRRSKGDTIMPETDVYVADTMGELGLFFRLCPISFIGKSLVDLGGQNPIEPARLESAILFGPHMWNFPDIAERLLGSGGARNVTDSNDLADAVSTLLGHDEKRLASIAIARTIAESETQVLASVLNVLQPFVTVIGEKNEEP